MLAARAAVTGCPSFAMVDRTSVRSATLDSITALAIHLGRPAIPQRVIREIQDLAMTTDLTIRQIQSKISGRASRGFVGEVTKRTRDALSAPV